MTAGSNSGTMSWLPEDDATATQIQYRPLPVGTAPANTVIVGSGITSKNLTGLLENTYYQSRIRHSCSGELSVFRYKPFVTAASGSRLMDRVWEVEVFPNPASETVNIAISNGEPGPVAVSYTHLTLPTNGCV